jgi:fructoselysine-6-P-deglycase FrlB-like protein
VVLTRSGTTTEVLDLMAALRAAGEGHRARMTVLTAVTDAPAAGLADGAVVLDFADERSVVQTRFATSALALLRTHLGQPPPVAEARAALESPVPLRPADVEQVTFLGSGWVAGLAQEAALKCREAAGWWAEAYPAMEYRHGPIAIGQPGRAVWPLDHLPAGLADAVERTGATLVPSGGRDPLAELVVAQRFAVAAAARRGLDPDRPRHLTRSVVLR